MLGCEYPLDIRILRIMWNLYTHRGVPTHEHTHTYARQHAPRPCRSVLRCRRSPPSGPGPARPGTSYETTHSSTCVVLTSIAAGCGSPFGGLLPLLLLLPLTTLVWWSAAIFGCGRGGWRYCGLVSSVVGLGCS